MAWTGTGLTLAEFLGMQPGVRRDRFSELSDVDQLLFVERHLDPLEAILHGYPQEDMLPVLPLDVIRQALIRGRDENARTP